MRKRPQYQPSQRTKRNRRQLGKSSEIVLPNSPKYTHDWREKMDEMRKGLLEIQADGRQNQGRLDASMASLNDLIKQRENLADTRMAEMSAVMKERDRQADERMKLMSDLMQRRETDADT